MAKTAKKPAAKPAAGAAAGGGTKLKEPKKKVRKVKRVDYHSSDEDSEVEGQAHDAPRNSDVKRVVSQEKGPVLTGENLKPILKRVPTPAKPKPTVHDLQADDDDEGDESEELARNTAMNSIPALDEAGSEEDDDEDGDAASNISHVSMDSD